MLGERLEPAGVQRLDVVVQEQEELPLGLPGSPVVQLLEVERFVEFEDTCPFELSFPVLHLGEGAVLTALVRDEEDLNRQYRRAHGQRTDAGVGQFGLVAEGNDDRHLLVAQWVSNPMRRQVGTGLEPGAR